MSADNGIYILESLVHDGKEYRVAECQAIENINYVPKSFYAPDDKSFWNLPSLWASFGKCQIFHDEAAALQEAQRLYRDPSMVVCEYGISTIQMDRSFPTFDDVLKFALSELDHSFACITNDANPVKGRVLYNIRFSLESMLHLLIEGLAHKTEATQTKVPTVVPIWDGNWEDGPFKERDRNGKTTRLIAVKPTGHTGQLL